MLWPGTDAILTVIILLNTGALCAYEPMQKESRVNTLIARASIATTAVFTIEIVAKAVAFGVFCPGGFIWNPAFTGKNRRVDVWHIFDVIVVILGWCAIGIPRVGQLSVLRLFRLVRGLSAFPSIQV